MLAFDTCMEDGDAGSIWISDEEGQGSPRGVVRREGTGGMGEMSGSLRDAQLGKQEGEGDGHFGSYVGPRWGGTYYK